MVYPVKGVGNATVMDGTALREKYGVDGSGYADLALLRGDPSDGLPGVPGIGEKTAAKLLGAYGDLAGIMAAVDDPTSRLTPAQRRRLRPRRGRTSRWRRRWCGSRPTCRCSAYDPELPRTPRDPERLAALAKQWGLGGSLERLLTTLGG